MYTTRVFCCFTGLEWMQGGAMDWNGCEAAQRAEMDARRRGGPEGNEGRASGEV